MGDYAQQTDFEAFLAKKQEGARNDLARLNGARFVTAVEAREDRRLDEAAIKQVTGGDTITARFLYREYFEFVPQFKLFLATNHKPRITGTDEAIWRRIKVVPFTVTIPPERRDKQLLEKLNGELPGILAWAVRGCLAWQQSGLGEPPEVADATASYRLEMDTVGQFLEDCCVTGRSAHASAADLYSSYESWCKDSGEFLMTQRRFGGKLGERGFSQYRERGQRYWLGIGLKPVRE